MIQSFIKKLNLCTMLVMVGMVTLFAACSDDKDEFLQAGNGYVQFKVYKANSAQKSASGSRAAENTLENMAQAHKMQVVLKSDNGVLTHTVELSSYNAESAEYGLRSEKLQLLAGSYTLLGYYIFDKAEKQIFAGEPAEPTVINVVAGGLTMQDVYARAVLRGKVSFVMVKDIQVKSRSANENTYSFHNIGRASIAIRNTFTKKTYEFNDVKAYYSDVYTMQNGASYTSGVCEIDTVLNVEAGTYEITRYVTSTRMGSTLGVVSADKGEHIGQTFVVNDNELTQAEVPVTITEADANIKDYIALKEIWDALDGPNWSYRGEGYDRGINWNFNKDIDLWGIQPGVSIDSKGRVVSLSIGDFCPKGFVPDALGELTELQILSLGTHNDKLGGVLPAYPLNGDANQLKAFRDDYHQRAVYKDSRTELIPQMQLALELHGVKINKNASFQKKDVQWGDYTNEITGITEEIGKLKKLEQLYIANGKVAYLPESIALLDELKDLEIYNCTEMKYFPDVIADLKNLQALNIAMNKQWSAASLKSGLQQIAWGDAGRELQILYMGYNNLEELPREMRYMHKLGKLDCTHNKIKKLNALGSSVNLVQLNMDYNEITEVPADFCGVADVENYTFSHNKIKKFPNIFNAMSKYIMSTVDFSYNEIDGFDGVDNDGKVVDFKGVNASTVNLSGNKLTRFPGCLFHTNSPMNVLQLSSNKIEEITNDDLRGEYMYMITTLDLSNNRISRLPSRFEARSFPYLYGLDLSYNRFDHMPMVQFNIAGLTTFALRYQRDANGNRCMKEWPTGIWKHSGLRALLLGGNDIRKVDDSETISYLIYILEIADNPNIYINVSDVCSYIKTGQYTLIYDPTQNIVGCDHLNLDN